MFTRRRVAVAATCFSVLAGCGQNSPNAEVLGSTKQAVGPAYSGKIYWCCTAHDNPSKLSDVPGVGSAEEDYAVQLAGFLNGVLGANTFTTAKLTSSDPPPTGPGIYLINSFDPAAPAIPASLAGAQTQLTASTLPAYSLTWDSSSLWVIGRNQGVRNGTYDYLHRLGFRWLLPSTKWQITPSSVSLILPGSGPGVVAPVISTLTPSMESEPGDDPLQPGVTRSNGPSLWTNWYAHNSFPTNQIVPGASYESLFAERASEISSNKLALPEIAGVRTLAPDHATQATKIHSTGRQTFLTQVPGTTAMFTDPSTGTTYYEDLNDYSYTSLLTPPPSGAVKGVLQSLASQVMSKLSLPSVAAGGFNYWTVEPNDNSGGYCDCSKCQHLLAHVPGTFTNEQGLEPYVSQTVSSISDRVFYSANAAAVAMQEQFGVDGSGKPLKGVSLLAYSSHAPVPHIPIKPNVMVWPTPYYSHRQFTSMTDQQLLAAWQNKSQHDGFALGAYDLVSTPGGSYGALRENAMTVQTRLTEMHSYGINDVGLEAAKGGGPWGPSLLLASQMAWAPTTTAASMLDTFVTDAFGATAAPAVRPIYSALYEQAYRNDYLDLNRLLSLFAPAITAIGSANAEQQARFQDLESYVHYLRLLHDALTNGGSAVVDTYRWLWCMDTNQMLPTRRITVVLQAKGGAFADPNWTTTTASTTLAQEVMQNPTLCTPSLDDVISADASAFHVDPYRQVSFARSTSDYMLLPPTDELPNQTYSGPYHVAYHDLTRVVKKGFNHFIFVVPYSETVNVNLSLPNAGAALLQVYKADGTVIKEQPLQGPIDPVTVALGTLAAGNYEIDFTPFNPSSNYALWTTTAPSGGNDVGVPLAYKDGANFINQDWSYFYVPAEVDTFFLRGIVGVDNSGAETPWYLETARDGSGAVTILRSPTHLTDPSVVKLDRFTYQVKVNGRPGVWRLRMQSTGSAHLVNLPDVFSTDVDSVITSKRIRTAMVPLTGPATSQITSPNLKYSNKFDIKIAAGVGANQPLLTMGTGTALASPPPLAVRLLDMQGNDVPGSPFSLLPGGATPTYNIGSTQALAAGDYELQVTNPSIYNGYALIVPQPQAPQATQVASVDGYAFGNVNLPSYRQFFTLPKTSDPNRFIYFVAQPNSSVPILMYSYDSAGHETAYGSKTLCSQTPPPATCPQNMGNNVYEFAIPTTVTTDVDTLWAMNMVGVYNSDIRLLNAPQIMTFARQLHMVVAPSP